LKIPYLKHDILLKSEWPQRCNYDGQQKKGYWVTSEVHCAPGLAFGGVWLGGFSFHPNPPPLKGISFSTFSNISLIKDE
jgi:hypothetical protein